ncbi:MAG: threonine--tRNA ligase, partial [Sulfobacillus sp.]
MEQEVQIDLEGEIRRFPRGVRAVDLPDRDPEAVAAWIDGQVVDLKRPITKDGALQWLTFDDSSGRLVFRHSSAHLLAQAVKRLWPEAKLGTGPALDDGFYYDIWLPSPLSEADLARIEAEMRRIAAENLSIERLELTREEAKQIFSERGEEFKLQIVERIPDGAVISAYRQGDFVDLCAGPHLPA